MLPDLELLLKLQVIDYDLGELERSKEYLPDMMENLRREIEETNQQATVASEELQESQLLQKDLELQVRTSETDLQKYQQQMMSIKTNKEYDALVAQIDTVKGEISASETKLLETMERITSLEEELPQVKEKLGHVQENNTSQLSILQEKTDSIGGKVAGKEAEREHVLSAIPKPTRAIYERVRRGKGGAVVIVVKKRSCSACHKALTPKKVQEVKKADRIHTCESCGRLLYWDEAVSN